MPNRESYRAHKQDIDRRREENQKFRDSDEYKNMQGAKRDAYDRYSDALEEMSQAAGDLDRDD